MLTVILLLHLICIFSNAESQCKYRAVGDNVVIKLNNDQLNPGDHLIWKKSQVKVYEKKNSVEKTKNDGFNIDQSGSLIIKNIQREKFGTYIAEVFNSDGKSKIKTEVQLCVQEPVSEPSITVQCVDKGVNLSCIFQSSTETSVSWMKNGQKTDETLADLQVGWSELKPGDSYSCTVNNSINQKSAKDVQPACSNTGLNAENTTNADGDRNKEVDSGSKRENTDDSFLFGLDLWMVVLVAVAGGVFLILFIICVVCICCRRRNKSKAEEEKEFRLAPLMPDYSSQTEEQYMQQSESTRPSKSQRPLPPLPSA